MDERPKPVPEDAFFSEAYRLWGDGVKSSGGKFDGVWKWWCPDSGKLVMEQEYVGGDLIAVRNFYPDGKLLQEAVVEKSVFVEQTWFIDREQNWRTLIAGDVTIGLDRVSDTAVEIRKVPKTYPLTYHFFDAEGRRVRLLDE